MTAFIVALVVLLVGAASGSREAYSFSVDVPSPILASITGGGPPPSADTPAPPGSAGHPSNPNPGAPHASSPGMPYPTVEAAPTAASRDDAPLPAAHGSKWPAIILGTVVVLGLVLIVLYFVTRNNDD
jgi:hypothetical protein